MNWNNERVLIIGAARQGTALARYLSKSGAEVLLTDLRTTEKLRKEIYSLADCKIEWVLGSHPLSILEGITLICPSGGVPLSIPLLVEAKKQGIPFSNESQIFLNSVLCKVIAITGSAGKTTTASLVYLMAKAAVEEGLYRKAFIGGNIGNPLISDLNNIKNEDIVVMELSSFQLEHFTTSPPISALLNITPNHLDRHLTMEAYLAAKLNILNFQSSDQIAILGREDKIAWASKEKVKGKMFSFGHKTTKKGEFGTYIQDDHICLNHVGGKNKIMPIDEITLLGDHNLMNVLAACAIASAAGLSIQSMRAGVNAFEGIPHRLEFVRHWGGADWYNDSIATAPERTMAAIKSFNQPIVLLAGGRDKDLPWDDFANLASKKVDHFVLFGEATEIISTALNKYPGKYTINKSINLFEAVSQASLLVSEGDVLLFSPGGTSYDEFFDFAERGNKFKKLVNAL